MQRGRMREDGVFVQDQWRVRPNLTINAGLRYDVQNPFYPLNSSYTSHDDRPTVCGVSGVGSDDTCNLFQPGIDARQHPVYNQYEKGTHALQHRLQQLRAERRRGLDAAGAITASSAR